MAEYHVKTNKDGQIMAGTYRKEGGWNRCSDVTNEVMEAARDHLLIKSEKENHDVCMGWNYNNGKTLMLKLELKDTAELKE